MLVVCMHRAARKMLACPEGSRYRASGCSTFATLSSSGSATWQKYAIGLRMLLKAFDALVWLPCY